MVHSWCVTSIIHFTWACVPSLYTWFSWNSLSGFQGHHGWEAKRREKWQPGVCQGRRQKTRKTDIRINKESQPSGSGRVSAYLWFLSAVVCDGSEFRIMMSNFLTLQKDVQLQSVHVKQPAVCVTWRTIEPWRAERFKCAWAVHRFHYHFWLRVWGNVYFLFCCVGFNTWAPPPATIIRGPYYVRVSVTMQGLWVAWKRSEYLRNKVEFLSFSLSDHDNQNWKRTPNPK